MDGRCKQPLIKCICRLRAHFVNLSRVNLSETVTSADFSDLLLTTENRTKKYGFLKKQESVVLRREEMKSTSSFVLEKKVYVKCVSQMHIGNHDGYILYHRLRCLLLLGRW